MNQPGRANGVNPGVGATDLPAKRNPGNFLPAPATVEEEFVRHFGTREEIQQAIRNGRPGRGYAKFSVGATSFRIWFDTRIQHSSMPAEGGSISEGIINGGSRTVEFRCMRDRDGKDNPAGKHRAIRLFVERLESNDYVGPLLDGFTLYAVDLDKALGDRVQVGHERHPFRYRPPVDPHTVAGTRRV